MTEAATAAAPRRSIVRQTSFSIDDEHCGLLDAFAAAVCGGNRSHAISRLIDLYAGREIERAQREGPPAVYEVDGWKKRRLTRELISEICGRIRDGATRADAYRLSGVTTSQASTWTQHGKRDVNAGNSSVHADFVMTLERVEAEVRVARNVEIGRKDPKWLQEREYGDQYGKVTRSDSSVTHKIEPLIVWENLSLPEARTLVALMRKASPAADDPSVSKTHRPAAELIPAEIIDGEAHDIDDTGPPVAGELTTGEAERETVGDREPNHDEEQDDAERQRENDHDTTL